MLIGRADISSQIRLPPSSGSSPTPAVRSSTDTKSPMYVLTTISESFTLCFKQCGGRLYAQQEEEAALPQDRVAASLLFTLWHLNGLHFDLA